MPRVFLLDVLAPRVVTYNVSKQLVKGDETLKISRCRASAHPLAEKLFAIDEVIMVIISPFFVELHTGRNDEVCTLCPKIEKVLQQFLSH